MKKILTIILFISIVLPLSAQTYEDLINRAMDFVEQKDDINAEIALKEAMRKEPANPNNTMLMVNLGTVQRNLGKFDEALLSYTISIDKYPNVIFVRHNRAALYCEMERYDDAMKDYNAILVIEPDNVEALYRRALLNLNGKNLLAAEEDFDKILKIEPHNLQAQSGLVMIMKRRSEWVEAEKAYTDLIYKHKTNGELYFNRAECYFQMKKLARTQEDISKALELGYKEPHLYILRGQLRLAQFDKSMAKEDFLKAKELGADEKIVNELLLFCK